MGGAICYGVTLPAERWRGESSGYTRRGPALGLLDRFKRWLRDMAEGLAENHPRTASALVWSGAVLVGVAVVVLILGPLFW